MSDKNKLTATFIALIAMIVVIGGVMMLSNGLNANNNGQGGPAAGVSRVTTGGPSTTKAGTTGEASQNGTTKENAANTATTETVATEAVTEALDSIEQRINDMSLHEKVCQLFIVTPEGLTKGGNYTAANETTKASLKEYPVGGIVYFSKNIESADAISEMISNTSEYAAEEGMIPLFYSVDEEGGTVARCAEKAGTTSFSPMYDYKSEGEKTAYDNAKQIATDISGLGFNLDFAPVADTWSNPANTVIGKRAYSDDFHEAATLSSSAVKGFQDGGVFCTLKHFPGHGNTSGDSHYGVVYSDKNIAQLLSAEFLAFRSGIDAGADMVMVGHITMNGVDRLPASISRIMITSELRSRLGFDGVVITDSLSMKAVADNYSSGELAVRVLEAGGDMLLMPADLGAAATGVEAAVAEGRLSEERIDESVYRILELKSKKMDITNK